MAGLAVVRDIRSPRSLDSVDDATAYQDNLLAEFVLARSAHGVADATVRGDVAAIEEFLAFVGVWAWEVEPVDADRFLAEGQRGRAVKTRLLKAGRIALFYRFVEVRYQGEIAELCGRVVVSPIDGFNRPTHTGEFSVRVPPSRDQLRRFFAGWREELATARKWGIAARNYAMARVAGEVGLRAAELCALSLDDCHFDHGPLGKIHVRAGKGARGSGPRERLVPMLGDARAMLVWWVAEVRGEFDDEWERPGAVLFPSERGGRATPETFRRGLQPAAQTHLGGPVRTLTPHVLRHACASSLYQDGMSLAAIQALLGHRWLTTTLGYVHVAAESIEAEYQAAAERAAARFVRS
jgi:integrase